MGKLGGFLRYGRVEQPERDPRERVGDFREFVGTVQLPLLREQGARCMECGVPFCHNGCPLGNLIPEWNDLVYRDRWREAIDQLHRTNNFPEFTGRLCPAPCEAACVLELREGEAVTIKQIEVAIVNRAWEEGWIVPRPPRSRTGRSVAVVGAGPSGLACAQQLNRIGHAVTVYERDEAGGGLIRFGVPDFKLEKWLVERRLEQLEAEGVGFRYGVEVGADLAAEELVDAHDAVVLAVGSRIPRDLPVPGRELEGVHFALEYLAQRNRWAAREHGPPVDGAPPPPDANEEITARGKHVVVVGGGDTGADCVANAHREGAASVTQVELVGEPPPSRRDDLTPWPTWPMKLRTSYALKEGGERDFAVSTTALSGRDGRVARIHWVANSGAPPFEPLPGTEREHPADLVLLAMGFVGPERRVLEAFGVDGDERGNAHAPAFETSTAGVFAAGDARRGQSLIVWAIAEGRRCADAVDRWLTSERRPSAHTETPRRVGADRR
jgi:glutamate synthase (NADPH/NADH) small chain